MVSTRSSSSGSKQTHLEDFVGDTKAATKRESGRKSGAKNPPKKQSDNGSSAAHQLISPPQSPAARKRNKSGDERELKKQKLSKEKDGESSPVLINRAPVLHLWGACVTQFLYPELEWSTCLSAGSAISTICAVSKGRAIGAIEESEITEEKQKKEEDRKAKEQDLDELEVMQFKLKLHDEKVMFSGMPQSDKQDALEKKFGDRFGEVKEAMDSALQEWKGAEDELSSRGFGMYEDFRPSVAKGQKGWGRKGELNLSVLRKSIARQ